jgi:Putative restriction endonuclease
MDLIDFSTFPDSDGEPMAENDANRIQMSDLIFALQRLLSARDDVYVGGNLLVYYNPANGWDHLSPDVFVAFDASPGLRHSWQTWVEGKFPDVVFEITSPSTESVDLGGRWGSMPRLAPVNTISSTRRHACDRHSRVTSWRTAATWPRSWRRPVA